MIKLISFPKDLLSTSKARKSRRASGDTVGTEPACSSQFLQGESASTVDKKIAELENTVNSMEIAIQKTKILAEHRLECGGKNAAIVALTQLKNYQAVKEHSKTQIRQLERFTLQSVKDEEALFKKVEEVLSSRPERFAYELEKDADMQSLQMLLDEF